MNVIVMQGIPGAGKTYWAEKEAGNCRANGFKAVVVCADDYFADRPFNRDLLDAAHGQCLRAFIAALKNKTEFVFVANTNTKIEEAAPYMALAGAFGYKAKLVRISTPVQVAHKRCVHDVPLEVIKGHAERLTKFRPPARWVLENIQNP
jgi:predicted kinase